MARQGGYIRPRPGTRNLFVRFIYAPALRQSIMDMGDPDPGVTWAKSLGTTDYREAEVLAAPYIQRHKERLLFHALHTSPKELGVGGFEYDVEPDTNELNPDGTSTIADEKWVKTYAADRTLIGKVPNVRRFRFEPNEEGRKLPIYKEVIQHECARKKVQVKDNDADLVERYVEDRKLRKDDADGTRRTLQDWKEVTGGKLLHAGDRKDAQAVADYLREVRDLSTGRARKLVRLMAAAIQMDMDGDPRNTPFKFNPFAKVKVVDEDGEGETERPPYNDEEIKLIKANLPRFDDEQRLMLVWHLCTGIRPGGIYSMRPQEDEVGRDRFGTTYRTRHVRITKDKGKYGPRNVPIPQVILDMKRADGSPLLPETWEGSLFSKPLPQFLTAIRDKLDRIGAHKREGVTIYSGRHRARDRMRNNDVDKKMSHAILGHTREDANEKYGHGYAMWKMKPEIDKIGL